MKMFVSLPPAQLRPHLRELASALQRLQDAQGLRARRNARELVRYRITRLKEAVEHNFPLPAKPARKRRRLSFTQRINRWDAKQKKEGYVLAPEKGLIAALASVGIRPRLSPNGNYYLPKWAVLAATSKPGSYNKSLVASLKRDLKRRKAFLAADALNAGTSQ